MASPREALPSTTAPTQAQDTPAWSGWLSAAIALVGVVLVVKTAPMSQGEWNDLYGKPR